MRVGGPGRPGSRETMRPCASAPFGAAGAQETAPGVAGTARLDRRTKNLTKRLRPGDIAVIDHVDIDRVSADALVGCRGGGRRQRRAEHLRPLSEPRARDPRRRPASRCSTTSAARCSPASRRATRSGSTATSCSPATAAVLAEGVAAGRRERSREAMAEARAGLVGAARGVRRQHDGVHEARARRCCSTASACPTSRTADRRPARARRRPRLRLQGGPRRAAALHPRVPAGPDRRRRRRGRAASRPATSPT